MGLVAPLRYILLSDALLDNLDEEHVRAIFAHETGHVVHRHIRYMVLFALAAVALLSAVVAMARRWLGVEELSVPAQAGVMLALGAAWLLAFGMLSRRFERQADVFAAASAGDAGEDDPSGLSPHGAEVFCDALLEVARLNAIPLDRRNFRHGTIRSRVRFLSEMVIRGVTPAGVDRRIRCIKVGICALAAAGVILAAVLYDRDNDQAPDTKHAPPQSAVKVKGPL